MHAPGTAELCCSWHSHQHVYKWKRHSSIRKREQDQGRQHLTALQQGLGCVPLSASPGSASPRSSPQQSSLCPSQQGWKGDQQPHLSAFLTQGKSFIHDASSGGRQGRHNGFVETSVPRYFLPTRACDQFNCTSCDSVAVLRSVL